MKLSIERLNDEVAYLADKEFVDTWIDGDIFPSGTGHHFIYNVQELENTLSDDQLRLVDVVVSAAYSLGVCDSEIFN